MTRAILRDASLGHLGTELRTTADEILFGDGLRVGEGTDADRGETAEWGAAMREAELADQLDASLVEESPFTERGRARSTNHEPESLERNSRCRSEPFAEPRRARSSSVPRT